MAFKSFVFGVSLGSLSVVFASDGGLPSYLNPQDVVEEVGPSRNVKEATLFPNDSLNSSPNGSFSDDSVGIGVSSGSLKGSFGNVEETSEIGLEQFAFEERLSGKCPLFPEASFKSEYGILTLHAGSLHENLNIAGWLRDKLETVFKEAQKGSVEQWLEICRVLNEIYHCSDEEAEAIPELFWDDLDNLYAIACVQLAEKGRTDARFNLHRAFCTSDRDGVLAMFNFKYKNGTYEDVSIELKEESRCTLLSTAGVYLYALSKFLKGYNNPDDFGSVYKRPITFLRENAPRGNFVSWALSMAANDTTTQDLVKDQKPIPSSF